MVGIPGRDRLRKVVKDTDNKLKPDDSFFWGRATSSSGKERSGWYYDLPETGERIVYDSTYISLSTTVMFNSLIPDAATAVVFVAYLAAEGMVTMLIFFRPREMLRAPMLVYQVSP